MTNQTLLSYVRRAVSDYGMIEEGDRIAVGVSGGKDSLTLLCALQQFTRFSPAKYEVEAVLIDLGFGADFVNTKALCEQLGVPLTIVKTQIGEVIFHERREKNPCSLCAKMRRGALAREAKKLGCNKLALGHHRDDVLETLLLNLFYEGRIATFEPKSYLDRSELTLIRPLLYLPEKEITYYCTRQMIKPDKSLCPADSHTRREDVKQLLLSLSRENRDLKSKLFGAIQRAGVSGFFEPQHEQKHLDSL